MEEALFFDNITYRYEYDEYPIFSDFSLSVKKGGVTTVLSDIQSGKTTLCKLIMGVISPQKGRILYLGKELPDILPSDRAILYLPAVPLFFGNKTVGENILYPLRLRKLDKKIAEEISRAQAEKFHLTSLWSKKAGNLDERQKIKLALARGFAKEVKTALVDGLPDCLSRCEKAELIDMLEVKGLTVVNFTSDTDSVYGRVAVTDAYGAKYFDTKEEAETHIKSLLWLADNKETENDR